VMGRSAGDLILYDTTCTGQPRDGAESAIFKPFFAGLGAARRPSLKNSGGTHKTTVCLLHWFLGAISAFRRR